VPGTLTGLIVLPAALWLLLQIWHGAGGSPTEMILGTLLTALILLALTIFLTRGR
jgi:hypothetical protein